LIVADCRSRGRPGDGWQVRDFVYVGDAVAAMDNAGTDARVFNVSADTATSILDLATAIGELLEQAAEIRHVDPRPGDIPDLDRCPHARGRGAAARRKGADSR
jgi:nucleoside-diphosphate-sugar epimerase